MATRCRQSQVDCVGSCSGAQLAAWACLGCAAAGLRRAGDGGRSGRAQPRRGARPELLRAAGDLLGCCSTTRPESTCRPLYRALRLAGGNAEPTWRLPAFLSCCRRQYALIGTCRRLPPMTSECMLRPQCPRLDAWETQMCWQVPVDSTGCRAGPVHRRSTRDPDAAKDSVRKCRVGCLRSDVGRRLQRQSDARAKRCSSWGKD